MIAVVRSVVFAFRWLIYQSSERSCAKYRINFRWWFGFWNVFRHEAETFGQGWFAALDCNAIRIYEFQSGFFGLICGSIKITIVVCFRTFYWFWVLTEGFAGILPVEWNWFVFPLDKCHRNNLPVFGSVFHSYQHEYIYCCGSWSIHQGY